MGENYFTQRLAPIVLDTWYQTLVAKKSGDLKLKDPMWAVDKTASSIIGGEREHLNKWVDQLFPTLPLVGNMVSDEPNPQGLVVQSRLMVFTRQHR